MSEIATQILLAIGLMICLYSIGATIIVVFAVMSNRNPGEVTGDKLHDEDL